MRPVVTRDEQADKGRSSNSHVMSAAAVVFSFGGLQEKLGQPMSFLHAPVPGYESDLSALVDRALNGLKAERPLWRNNWFLVSNIEVINHLLIICVHQK